MKKRVLSLALAAAMAASLTACSGNSTTTETTAAVEETKAAENANTESKEADGSGVDVSDWKNRRLHVSFLTMQAAVPIQLCVP